MKIVTQPVSIINYFSRRLTRIQPSRARIQPGKGFTMRNPTETPTKLLVTNLAAVTISTVLQTLICYEC